MRQLLQSGKTGIALPAGGAAVSGLLFAILFDWLSGGALGSAGAAGAASVASVAMLSWMTRGADDGDNFTGLVGRSIDNIMIGAAETAYFVDSVKKKIHEDVQIAVAVADSAEQMARSTERIAANAGRAAKVAAQVRSESADGRAEADQGLQRIGIARAEARQAEATMIELQQKSRAIAGITEVISEISARTNLLALNAAIEAARAGEHGRGFAVVAGEVRQLAHRTREATDEIGATVRAITEQAEKASRGMASLNGVVSDAAGNVERVHGFLSHIEASSAVSEQEIGQIAALAREHVDSARGMTESLSRIRDSMLSTDAALPRATESAMALADKAETIAAALVASSTSTLHDPVRIAVQQAAHDTGVLFSNAIKAGQITREALFDRRYKPIPGTNPPKHSTRFDAFTDRVLPALQEELLARIAQLAYAGAVDDHGYFPTHNKKFSQPLTGDYDIDIVNNRTKRIFDDRTGARCGKNTQPFLLQTYKRDTGEVMHDLSAPIYVDGQHWGGFRVGYRSSAA
jgi:methyl-accepting chemotaxis protein